MRGRTKFKKYRRAIYYIASLISVIPYHARIKLFESFRSTKGIKGIVIRYILLKTIAKECGDNVSIHPNVFLFNLQNISFGNNISVHPMCYIDGAGTITIKDDVSIAHGSTILSSTHTFSNMDEPIKDQPVELKSTSIENNVWIGAKATILYGVSIESGSIVGAGAVVTKSFPENTILGGIPARIIKKR